MLILLLIFFPETICRQVILREPGFACIYNELLNTGAMQSSVNDKPWGIWNFFDPNDMTTEILKNVNSFN